MSFSTVAQCRANLLLIDQPLGSQSPLSDSQIQDRISQSDNLVNMDLQLLVDFSKVPDVTDSNFPLFINLLSQYKSCYLVLFKLFGSKRSGDDVSDIDTWKKEYDNLLHDCKTGKIPMTLQDGTPINYGVNTLGIGRKSTSPVLGTNKYGKFESESEQAKYRPRHG